MTSAGTTPQSLFRRSLSPALLLGSFLGLPMPILNRFVISIEMTDQRATEAIHHRLPPGLPSLSPNTWLCVLDGISGEKFYMLSELQVAKVLAAIENSIATNGVKLDVR